MELATEIVIDAPAAATWRVLGERFGHIGEWAAPILASTLEGEPRPGAVRTCRIPRVGPVRAGEVQERLTAFDPSTMTLAYEAITGTPAFIRRAVNRWSVVAEGDRRSRVRSHATLELRGAMRLLAPLIGRQMRRVGVRVLEELRHHVEHGRPHPRKVAASRG